MAVGHKKVRARFYETAAGIKPVRDWILSLAVEDRKRIGKDIQKVEFGWPIGMPYCRSIAQGLWEIRSNLSDGRIGRVAPDEGDSEMRKKGKIAARSRVSTETFDEFLKEEGLLEEAEAGALKEIIADQIAMAMRQRKITKSAMASRMRTSRRQVDRLLDPGNPSVTLLTLRRAASALGKRLHIELR
jgi:hypothetical protein